MDPSPNPNAIGDGIERALDDLRAHLEPRAYDEVVELLQLITELYGDGLRRVVDAVTGLDDVDGARVLRALAGDELVASLLVVHGLHPDGLAQRVSAALDEVRPFLGGHGGDVELLEVDEDAAAVHLRLLGSCDGCPSSAVTLRHTVERAIMDAAPEITVIDVEEPSAAHRTPVLLTQKPAELDPATGCGAMT
jgi:Fe-S cluster biogenesis protein NfuA